jgi:steroid 5-alpha reductase family enzyme
MTEVLVNCAIIIFVYATLWFIISLIKQRNDIVDIAWGLGYIVLCVYLLLSQERSSISMIHYVLITIWGVRLSAHIFIRNKGKKEDFRYKKWREEWGKHVVIRSYLQVFLLQGFILLIVMSPVMIASIYGSDRIHIISIIGIFLWIIGFFFQSVGDYQLLRFLSKRKSNADMIQSGLWKYTRHPNYFGESAMWWGIFIISLPVQYGAFGVISPILITYLLLYVSGIPMLEKKYEGNLVFDEYKRKTSAFFPLPPKK